MKQIDKGLTVGDKVPLSMQSLWKDYITYSMANYVLGVNHVITFRAYLILRLWGDLKLLHGRLSAKK